MCVGAHCLCSSTNVNIDVELDEAFLSADKTKGHSAGSIERGEDGALSRFLSREAVEMVEISVLGPAS